MAVICFRLSAEEGKYRLYGARSTTFLPSAGPQVLPVNTDTNTGIPESIQYQRQVRKALLFV